MKIGIVARVDDSGLSRMTYDFWRNIYEIKKQLVVLISDRNNDVYRYPKATICAGYPTLEAIDIFLEDLDLVLIFETPYNWNILKKARDKGIKTVLIPMYEWTDPEPPIQPDLYLCPSLLDYDYYKDYPSKYIQTPVDRKAFPFKLRKEAKTFVFNNGGGGSGGRNGLQALLQAIPLVKSDVRFIIRSLRPIPEIEDKRVKVSIGDFSKEELFGEGDVFLFPHMFNGLSLPIQEALSSGMPVLSTNIYPHNTYLPKSWLFEPDGFEKGRTHEVTREINIAILNPQKIADKIDEWSNRDIIKDSQTANDIAETFSWKNSKEKILEVLSDLVKK